MSNLSKQPIKYYKGDTWNITEEGFDPSKQRISESIFSVANEYMGVRGYFEEGYSGDHLLGSYFNHLFVYLDIGYPQIFKGFVKKETGMVNAVDWLYTRMRIDDEQLDLATSKFSGFRRTLDMKKGIMTRDFIWETATGKQLKVKFTRFTNLAYTKTGGQKISIKPINFSGEIDMTMGLDFNTIYELASGWDQTQEGGVAGNNPSESFWIEQKKQSFRNMYAIQAKTKVTENQLFSCFTLNANEAINTSTIEEDKFIGVRFRQPLEKGRAFEIEKTVINHWKQTPNATPVWEEGIEIGKNKLQSYSQLFAQHHKTLSNAWETMWIDIDNDPELLQGIRFSLLQNYQTYHCESSDFNALCKGMTGEIYAGWVWWDSEIFVLRFHLFTNPEGVKNMLLYRYKKLPQAMERAKELGLEGARYPFASITGKEDCGTWQHVDLEIHINGAVAYGIWQYINTTRDKEFLYNEGIEMLIQINRCNASWGEYGSKTGKFGLFGVMGPDEQHMMVNNNCYTNVMAKKAFEFAITTLQKMKHEAPESYKQVLSKTNLKHEEINEWKKMATNMRIPKDDETGIYEQHDGYFDLPHVDLKTIPDNQIPIAKHWPYIKIFRYDVIKQPDVLNLFYFFNHDYNEHEKHVNYDYYEERTLHESSLSPAVHAVLAIELDKMKDGYDFTEYSCRLDLDNYNRNTEQGLHVSASAGAWATMLHGWAGMRIDGEILTFNPKIWKDWNSYTVRFAYQGAIIELNVNKNNARFDLIKGKENIELKIFNTLYVLRKEGIEIEI